MTYQTGQDIVVRAQFINAGKLANTQDTQFRVVQDDWPVFALAHDLGTVSSTASASAVFSIGFARDPALQYLAPDGSTQLRSSYFWTKYQSMADAVSGIDSTLACRDLEEADAALVCAHTPWPCRSPCSLTTTQML